MGGQLPSSSAAVVAEREITVRFRNALQCWLLPNNQKFKKIPLTFLYLPWSMHEKQGFTVHEPLCIKQSVVSRIGDDSSVELVDNVESIAETVHDPIFTVTKTSDRNDKVRYTYKVNERKLKKHETKPDSMRVVFNSNIPYFHTTRLTAEDNNTITKWNLNSHGDAQIHAPSKFPENRDTIYLRNLRSLYIFRNGAFELAHTSQPGNGLDAIYYSGYMMFNRPRYDATSVMTSISFAGYGVLSRSSLCSMSVRKVAPVTPELAAISSSAIGALLAMKSTGFFQELKDQLPCELVQMAIKLPAVNERNEVIPTSLGKADAEFVTGDGAYICNDGIQHLKDVHAHVKWSSLLLLKHVETAQGVDAYMNTLKHNIPPKYSPFDYVNNAFNEALLPVVGFGDLEWSHEYLGEGFRTLEYTEKEKEKEKPRRRFLFMFVILEKKYGIIPSEDYLTLELPQTQFMAKIATNFLDQHKGDVVIGVSGGGMRSFTIGQHFLTELWRELQVRHATDRDVAFLAQLKAKRRTLVMSGVSGGAWTAVRFLHNLCRSQEDLPLPDPQVIIKDICGRCEELRLISIQNAASSPVELATFLKAINSMTLYDVVTVASAVAYDWSHVMKRVVFASQSEELLPLLGSTTSNPYNVGLLIGSTILGDTTTVSGVRRRD